MERRRQRRARGCVRSAPGSAPESRSAATGSAQPPRAQLWLFPGAAGLHDALLARAQATRQICCSRGRLAVLERGGAGVQVHPGSNGAGKPKHLKLEKKMKIHSMDQGREHLLVLSSNGRPFEYNYSIEHPRFQRILQEKSIIQITCGDYHSLALSKGGELFAWGQNLHGQLGLGTVFLSTPTPQRVETLAGVPLVQISAGEAHSMALSMSGNIYSWGKNEFGQLGLGHTMGEASPSLIEALADQRVEFLTCGGSHTALLTEDGLVFTFGAGNYGQLGHSATQNELRPRLVTELTGKRVTQIACGRWHTLAYVSDLGKVFSFGSGKEGQLGNSGTQNQLTPLPMRLSPNEELQLESHTSEKELIMIAGENQSILLWMDKENSYVNLRRKIPTLNEETVKRWIADVEAKQCQNTKRNTVEMTSVHLDLKKARNIFKKLTQKDWISDMITTCLRDNLLKNLTIHSPHQEALGIFFLLPEYPVMHEASNSGGLVVQFAEAVCRLSDQFAWILEEYWATLQESTFRKLIQMFKGAFISQLSCGIKTAENKCHVKALVQMLEKLHRVNQTSCQLPENIFEVDELSHCLCFEEEAYWRFYCKNILEIPDLFLLSHFPFIFNILSKTKLLYADSAFKIQFEKIKADIKSAIAPQRRSEVLPFLQPTLNLTVRRDDLVEDVLNQLSQSENEDLRKELWVSFSGEIGYDLGGVRREFFHCLFEKMTQPEYGMFTYPEEASYMWFPVRPQYEEKRYFFFGVLCGLSVFSCNVANIPFPLALFKKLLGQIPSLEDLKELSPVFGKGLQMLLDHEDDDFVEVFYIHFNVHWDRNDADLVPNGSRITVDQTNKRDYVSKCVDYVFNVSVKAVYEEFQRGFYKVCDKEIISIFHPDQLKNVVVGNTDYDWETFEKKARYEQGYDSSHPTILMFWEAFHKLNLEDKKKFLVFLTGTDRTQIKDLKTMKITFWYIENSNESDPMRARTCFSILYLPKYSTMKRMEEALQGAIDNSRGFG
ncbi:E3 ISG15--protein ligase HERC5 isoform X2 [Nycticebus coucang]|uniref:E3 ISG15--protein ligase HERC5 isoform X2 n=1 Tax=Nycticebus coucang TaxID=9470 RepID=UPI00234D6947|nr:E3 ISG15--protein ligase HERC5 isoform X2 [Nycticebus coucang]